MAEEYVDNVTLKVLRVTDEHSPEDLQIPRPRELGSGFYEIGVEIDGVFISFLELKAGDVDQRIANYKKAHPPAKGRGAAAADDTK